MKSGKALNPQKDNRDNINTIDFFMFDPVKAGESWTGDYAPDFQVVETIIDGRNLVDIIYEEESRYEDAKEINRKKDAYGHLSPKELYDDLYDAFNDKNSFAYQDGAYLFCCGDCGDTYCWSVLVKIRQDDQYVYWEQFNHSHRDWQYHLHYKFNKAQYEKALMKLKKMSENQARV